MGFLHANDIPGEGSLHDRLAPGQKLMVQIEKEPTGKKGRELIRRLVSR